MKVTLISPPWALSEQYGLTLPEVGSIEEPLGLAYIAAVLEKKGHQCRIIDGFGEQMDQNRFREVISSDDSDLYGVSASTPMIKRTTEAVKIINEVKPDTAVMIGGPHVGAMLKVERHEELFKAGGRIDYAIYGEGELTVAELVEKLESGRPAADIDGTIVNEGGRITVNKPREVIDDLDSIPFPARHLLPKGVYRPSLSRYRRLPVRSIIISRGCPYKCIYCSNRYVFGPRIRSRKPEYIVDEIQSLVENFGVREVRFWDDTFTLNKRLVLELCREIVDRKIDVLWTCFGRLDNVDPEMLEAMKKAGCWQIDYGVESGNDRVLKSIKKGFTTKQALDGFRLTRKHGIFARSNFILGLPEDTLETIEETIDFALACDANIAGFYLPQAYPGTELYDIAIKENALTTDDWSKYIVVGDEPSYLNPRIGSIKKLKELQRKAYRRYYMRPKVIVRAMLGIRSFSDLSRYIRGFFAAIRL
ncbi:MAG TPA: radical SAM protein [Nitrospirae bacterium]|nr:oxygen-independent coproporphyrinogen-III oxidase 1 [bacterium BMS3Abin06]HDH11827.1 radical SAM protein [Nitrospirota bacterium]HDZ02831.1 radical SAM protein [Nitrospirota bacterium]